MNRKITSLALVALLVVGTIAQTGCGNTTTLNRIGAVVIQVAVGFKGEVAALKASGLLTPEKAARLDRRAEGLATAANALKLYLDGLPGITSSNKAEVVQKVSELTSLIAGLLQNADLLGVSPDSLIIKILSFGTVTLQQLAIVLVAINPPTAAPGSSAAIAPIPLASIKVALPPVPKGAEKYIKK